MLFALAAAAPAQEHGAAEHGSGGTLPPLNPDLFPHQIFWLFVAFGVLYALMSQVALPRVASVLDARAARIQRDLDSAAAASASADAAKANAERAQTAARTEARRIVDEMRASMNAALAEERAKSDAALTARTEEAEGKIALARTEALKSVDAIARDLAQEIVGKVSGTPRTEVAA